MRVAAIALLLTAVVAALLAGPPIGVRVWAALALTALPVAAVAQARLLAREPDLPVLPAYVSTIASLAVLAAITAIVAATGGLGLSGVGLRPVRAIELAAWAATVTVAAIAVVFLAHAAGVRETGVTLRLLPRTTVERRTFVAVCFAAGIFEEFLYRGFLLGILMATTGSAAGAAILTAISFGVVHGYQAFAGVVRAAVIGLLLTVPVLATGSILPSIVAHTAIDLILGLVLADRLRAERG
jgi:membrane protease YdiL (CAAX protease family)